jgi:hypothetical protein
MSKESRCQTTISTFYFYLHCFQSTGFSRDHNELNAACKDTLNQAELPLVHDVRPDETGPATKYYQDEIDRLLSFTVTFHTKF